MKHILLLFLVLLAGCASQRPVAPAATETTAATRSTPESPADKLLHQAYEELAARNTGKAVTYIDQAVEACRPIYENKATTFYSSRSQRETLYYLTQPAVGAQATQVVPQTCADALFLKGYTGIDLGQVDVAEDSFKRAIAMSPMNARYLAELGHIYHVRGDWKQALETFGAAEKAAGDFSPADVRIEELSRAKRGVGFSLIELGRLAEAEAKFRECLQLDSNDEKARHEIAYIEQLRSAAGNTK